MSVSNAYLSLSGNINGTVLLDEPLSRHTSYRIGGPAALFVRANDYAALVRTLEVLRLECVRWVFLGKGSNILADDAGYKGCVVCLGDQFARINVSAEEGIITAGAGAALSRVVSEAMRASLAGMEPCAGIPGTLGGALSMNAGTRREWIGQRVRDLVVLRPGRGMFRYAGSEIDWGYRTTSIPTSEIILEATLALDHSDKDVIAIEMDERLNRRRNTQPLSLPSCGSVFRNPPDQSVGKLIEECGLAGASQGGAQISTTHCNFIVNTGRASAADVLALISRAHDAVLERHGVDLSCEVKFLGFGG